MIQHIFTIMWNRKKTNFLIIVEIFFAFLVLFALSSFGYYIVRNYLHPLGFSYDHVIRVMVTNFGINNDDENGQEAILKQLKTALASLKGTESISRCGPNTPYSQFTSIPRWQRTDNSGKTIVDITMHTAVVDEDFYKVWDIDLIEGRWFGESDRNARLIPIVINKALQERWADDEPLRAEFVHNNYKVVGVIQDYRYKGEFHAPFYFYFAPLSTSRKVSNILIIKARFDAGVAFEEELAKTINNIAKSWTVQIDRVEALRKSYWQRTLSPIIALSLITGFLLFNVALGIFGVLWYTISRRRSEIGLRKALGAVSSIISAQIVGEALALTTLGVLMGYVVAVQFPLMNVFNVSSDIYSVAILVSSLCIYALVAMCALYPSWLAARIEPAVALHEE